MAKRISAVLLTIVMLFSITGLVKARNSELTPDIVTDKIIWIGSASRSEIVAELKEGTLGIVSFISNNVIGFDVPGGNLGTDIILTDISVLSASVSITTPVALKLVQEKLYVYFSRTKVLSLSWNDLSFPKISRTWFPYYVNAQIVKIVDTGAGETEINHCCNPPTQRIAYFYQLYVTTDMDPFNPPKESDVDILVGVMIPDFMLEQVKALTNNGDHIWIGVNGDNQIYIWLPH